MLNALCYAADCESFEAIDLLLSCEEGANNCGYHRRLKSGDV